MEAKEYKKTARPEALRSNIYIKITE